MIQHNQPCNHCEQLSMCVINKRFEWCYKCGHDEDRKHPRRYATLGLCKQLRIEDVLSLKDICKTIVDKREPSSRVYTHKTPEEKKEADRQYQANYRARHHEAILKKDRERMRLKRLKVIEQDDAIRIRKQKGALDGP